MNLDYNGWDVSMIKHFSVFTEGDSGQYTHSTIVASKGDQKVEIEGKYLEREDVFPIIDRINAKEDK